MDEGSLVATDQADRGQLSNVAANVMKFMWLARISRPDLMVAIYVCAGHITTWTVNDDKRMTRLAGYVAATLDHCHVMRVLTSRPTCDCHYTLIQILAVHPT